MATTTDITFTASAGSFTGEIIRFGNSNQVRLVEINWTSSAGGAAVATIPGTVKGRLIMVVTKPGSTTPTANYDLAINTAQSSDVLDGLGANRSDTTSEYIFPPHSLTVPDPYNMEIIDGIITVDVSNAGATKTGHIYMLMCD